MDISLLDVTTRLVLSIETPSTWLRYCMLDYRFAYDVAVQMLLKGILTLTGLLFLFDSVLYCIAKSPEQKKSLKFLYN